MYMMQDTPKTGLDIIEIKRIITPYRFYYEIEERYRDIIGLENLFGKIKYVKQKSHPWVLVLESINLKAMEDLVRNSYIIKIEDVSLPRFEEPTWRKTNYYEEIK